MNWRDWRILRSVDGHCVMVREAVLTSINPDMHAEIEAMIELDPKYRLARQLSSIRNWTYPL